jgi:uncharacterized protein
MVQDSFPTASKAQGRLAAIAAFVQAHLEQKAEQFPSDLHQPVYRWEHTLRVAQYGKTIAQAEGADVEAVVAACLLHDVAHFESDDHYQDHGRRGAAIALPLLQELGYAQNVAENICFSVAAHVDGDSGFDHPMTLEAQCVTDADNVERFGAYRILQLCVPEMEDFPKLVDKLIHRIEKLREYRSQDKFLETHTGDQLFKTQLDRQIAFFQALIDEYEITRLPGLDDSA